MAHVRTAGVPLAAPLCVCGGRSVGAGRGKRGGEMGARGCAAAPAGTAAAAAPRAPRASGSGMCRARRLARQRHVCRAAVDEWASQGVIGGQDFILSQASGVTEELFKGEGVMGVNADAASVDFRERAATVRDVRESAAWAQGLVVPQRFRDRLALHIARNYLMDAVGGRVPLIMGIWGAKGCGKTFNLELAAAQMGVRVVSLSAGELEDEWAGGVAERIRDRYRAAADCVANEGTTAILVISDIDAGLGRQQQTQATVNTQNASAELMAICDDPTRVRGGLAAEARCPRVPIVVTGNDLGRVYAPLLRDGRMDKFFWEPTVDEKAEMLAATFAAAGDESDVVATLTQDDAEAIVRAHPRQSLDFFGAARSRCVDSAVRAWIFSQVGGTGSSSLEPVTHSIMRSYDRRRGVSTAWGGAGGVSVDREAILRECDALVAEQQHVLDNALSREYFKNLESEEEAARLEAEYAAQDAAKRERELAGVARRTAAEASSAAAESPEARAALSAMRAAAAEERARRAKLGLDIEEPVEEEEAVPWEQLDADKAMLLMNSGWLLVDVRDSKISERETYREAKNVPACVVTGFGLDRVTEERIEAFSAELPSLLTECGAPGCVIMADSNADQEMARAATAAAHELGVDAAELLGGFEHFNKIWDNRGKRRMGHAWQLPGGEDLWTASN